jgi:hypothetical protein
MNNISMVKAGNDPAHSTAAQTPKTSVSFDTGTITSDSTLETVAPPATQTMTQKLPENTLTDYMLRYTDIGNSTFSNSSPAQFTATTIYPWYVYLTNAEIASKTANFQLIRGTLELMFVSAFPGNCHGAYAITAYPTGSLDVTGAMTAEDNFPVETCMQTDRYAYIDCAGAENVVMELPFVWPYDYAAISTLSGGTTQQPWQIKIWCLSPVQTSIPTGVASGNIQIYARLKPDYVLAVPNLQGKNRGRSKGADFTDAAIDKFAPGLNKYKGKVSGLADTVSKYANMAAGIPIIGPYASTISTVADTIGDVASWFGFTREDAETIPTSIMGKPFSNPAHIDGTDGSEMASLALGNSLSIDPLLGGAVSSDDIMSYESLFARWTLVNNYTWTPSQPSGTVLGSTYISPFFCRGSGGTATTTVNLTPAGYVGMAFNFWRGDMEYKILIPVSKLHRGTLQIYWVPVGTTTSASPTNASLNMVYDVSAEDTKEFLVGFAQDSPYNQNIITYNGTAIFPTGSSNGRLVFRVVNPLLSQNGTDSVDVLVFARAGKNMDFAMLADHITFTGSAGINQTSILSKSALYYQGGESGGASGDGDIDEDEMVEMVPSAGDYPGDAVLFGERIRSVRPLMQKFSWISHTMGATLTVNAYPRIGPYNWGAASTFQTLNYSYHFALLFCGIAGSKRYKLLGSNTASNELYGAWPSVINPALGVSPIDTLSHLSPIQTAYYGGAEFKLPYYSRQKFLKTRVTNGSFTQTPLCDLVVHTSTTGTALPFPRVAMAWGPDVRPVFFVAVPSVTLTYVFGDQPTTYF